MAEEETILLKGIRAVRTTFTSLISTVEKTEESAFKSLNPSLSTVQKTVDENKSSFFTYRKKYAWELIGLTTLAVGVASMPFGRSAFVRSTVLAGVLSTCVINPEYVVTKAKEYRQEFQ